MKMGFQRILAIFINIRDIAVASHLARLSLFCMLIALSISDAAYGNGLIRLFNLFPGQGSVARYEFRLKETLGVMSVTWSPDGRLIADSTGQFTNVWNVDRAELVHHFEFGVANFVGRAVSFSPDSKFFALCDGLANLRVFKTSDWQPVFVKSREDAAPHCYGRVAYSSDGRRLAFLDGNRELYILDTADWALVSPSLSSRSKRVATVNSFAFLPGSHDVILVGGEYLSKDAAEISGRQYQGFYWILREGATWPTVDVPVYTETPGALPVMALGVSHDGNSIALGTITGNGPKDHLVKAALRFYDLGTNLLIGDALDDTEIGHQNAIDYSADDAMIAVAAGGDSYHRIVLLDAKRHAVIDIFDPGTTAYDVAFDPRGGRLAAACGGDVLIYKLK